MAAARAAGGRARHGRTLTPRATDRAAVTLTALADALPLLASAIREARTLERRVAHGRRLRASPRRRRHL